MTAHAKPARGGARPGAGRPPRSVPGVKSQVALDEPLAAWLAEPYAGDLPEALRSTAQAWEALCHAAYPRLRDALSDADLRACLDVANGLMLTAGFLGAHLALDLADHGDPAYRKTAARVARLHRADAAALELWCRAWWAAQEDADHLAVWRRVAGQDHPGPQR